jgi:phosphofructokinase-like protein
MKNEQRVKRLGILSAGGDCPGINAVIRAAAKTAILDYDMEVIGFEDGYEGLVNNKYRKLDYEDVSGILNLGGTILGTSNIANPWRWPETKHNGKVEFSDVSAKVFDNFKRHKLDCLIVIGGDGTMNVASKFDEKALPIVGVPKTIDNDLEATDYTFGFYSAVGIATEAIDRIHSTAQAHHRVMIIELMGRYAGWLTLYSGVAGGADVILIPEINYKLESIADVVKSRGKKGKRFSIVAIAEGAREEGSEFVVKRKVEKSFDPLRLGGVGWKLALALEELTGLETRVTILGHLQRGGAPCQFDRLLATLFGSAATRLAAEGKFGRMVSFQGDSVTDVPLSEAIKSLKTVPLDHPLIVAARSLGTSFGNEDA